MRSFQTFLPDIPGEWSSLPSPAFSEMYNVLPSMCPPCPVCRESMSETPLYSGIPQAHAFHKSR